MEAYYMAPGTLLSALWWPQWEGNPKRRELYVNIWLTHFAVQHETQINVKQLYTNKNCLKRKRSRSKVPSQATDRGVLGRRKGVTLQRWQRAVP